MRYVSTKLRAVGIFLKDPFTKRRGLLERLLTFGASKLWSKFETFCAQNSS